MKRVWFILLMLAALTARAQMPTTNSTGTIQFAWQNSTVPSAGFFNYFVFEGTNATSYFTNWPVGTNMTATVSNLVRPATYYFSVTAMDTNAQITSGYCIPLIDNMFPIPGAVQIISTTIFNH